MLETALCLGLRASKENYTCTHNKNYKTWHALQRSSFAAREGVATLLLLHVQPVRVTTHLPDTVWQKLGQLPSLPERSQDTSFAKRHSYRMISDELIERCSASWWNGFYPVLCWVWSEVISRGTAGHLETQQTCTS